MSLSSANSSKITYPPKICNAPSPDYSPDEAYPCHQKAGRSWEARNLKYTICDDHLRPCCGRSGCIRRQACTLLGNPLSTAQTKEHALARMDRINCVFPDDTEVSTFLQCTHGSGCCKYVCPEC